MVAQAYKGATIRVVFFFGGGAFSDKSDKSDELDTRSPSSAYWASDLFEIRYPIEKASASGGDQQPEYSRGRGYSLGSIASGYPIDPRRWLRGQTQSSPMSF